MMISIEAMLMIADGEPGPSGCREYDILTINEESNNNITGCRCGRDFNVFG